MGAHILYESDLLNKTHNFKYTFQNENCEILASLADWQYWWWFWFCTAWNLYFTIAITLFQKRTSNMNPVMNTSYRSHAKWGDFVVAFIPLAWCISILINSNYILRIIEWQNENSLLTVRIQGKQWYWVYKYDNKVYANLLKAPRNVGNGNWYYTQLHGTYNQNTYDDTLFLANQLEYQDMYLRNIEADDLLKPKLEHNSLLYNSLKDRELRDNGFVTFIEKKKPLKNLMVNYKNKISQKNLLMNKIAKITLNPIKKKVFSHVWGRNSLKSTISILNYNTTHSIKCLALKSKNKQEILTENIFKSFLKKKKNVRKGLFFKINKPNTTLYFKNLKLYNQNNQNIFKDTNTQIDDTSDFNKNIRLNEYTKPLTIYPGILNKHNIDLINNKSKKNILFIPNFGQTAEGTSEKELLTESVWGFRQKRAKKKSSFSYRDLLVYDPTTLELIDNTNNDEDPYNSKKMFKSLQINKHKAEEIPVALARRLLQTKRTLILPAHINITLITNSYDVVHSWFIPGLGLKLDCVPGRSTHHMLYIENLGFYYGQCAEICGRYHHHMPIRMCALPLDQFLLWWKVRGIKRINRIKNIKSDSPLFIAAKKINKFGSTYWNN